MWDTLSQNELANISFTSKITKVRLNPQHIFVATKDKIFIYLLDGIEFLEKLEVDNHLGRIVLSPQPSMNPYLMYSNSLRDGQIAVFDLSLQKHVNIIKCHKTPVLKMAISAYGNMVATCSTQGSMIRVYSIPQGENLYTFTRGIKNTTQYSLSFSNDSSFLLSSSNTGTIHLFQLYKHANGHHSILKGDGNTSNVDD